MSLHENLHLINNSKIIKPLLKKIDNIKLKKKINLMEVCGGHTAVILKYGLKDLFKKINLLSGPGCPVCVTPVWYIDYSVELLNNNKNIIASYGDLLRVPGSNRETLLKKGKMNENLFIIYSAIDTLEIALNNPDKNVIFLAIGFETTSPATAVLLKRAYESGINNIYTLISHRVIPPALEILIKDDAINIDGFICPGHVSTIIGSKAYNFIAEKYNIPCVVSGFELGDILQTVYLLADMIYKNQIGVKTQYSRVVNEKGNTIAQQQLNDVFELEDSEWRGLGILGKSGYALKVEFKKFDALNLLPDFIIKNEKDTGCICGEILKGKKQPLNCSLFGKICLPDNPVGACMVSAEGACSNYMKYHKIGINKS